MLFAYWFRAAVAALVFATAIWQFFDKEIGNGIFFILISILIAATIWINEVIIMTFLSVRKGDFAKARKRLGWIKNPEWLLKSQRAYYFYLLGLVHTQSNEMSKAEQTLKRALSLGLAMKHDKAMAKLNLAGIAATKRRKREALNWLAEAKKDDEKKILADQIRMMKQQLSRI